jgi:hypothetical protein
MPARSQQTSFERRQERQSRATVQRREDRIERTGRQALTANAARTRHDRRRAAILRREQRVLRQHPGLTGFVIMAFVLVLFPFVPFVDFAMASGTTHFIVSTSFPYLDPAQLELRKVGICLGIFFLEVVVGLILSVKRDEGSLREAAYWATGGVFLAAGMAAMSVAVASAAPTMQLLTGADAAIPWLTGLIAFLFHAATIFGGDHIRFAFELLFLLISAAFFFVAGAIAGSTSRRNFAQLERADRMYDRARADHEQTFRVAIPRARFAADIEQLLAVTRGQDAGAPSPVAPPPAGAVEPEPLQPDASPDEQPSYADFFAEEEARRAETEVTA